MNTPRLVLGLLGGIASGKSTVAALIARSGPGRVVDADALAHVALDTCSKDGRLVASLGPWAVKNGKPDHREIARRVFKDQALLRALERLIHPLVTNRIDEALEEHLSGRGEPVVLVLDVPLLIEVGLDRRCDALWFVDVPDEARFARAEKRLGLSKEEVLSRETAQSPLDRKRARADLVIDNSGPPERLSDQVEAGLKGLGLTRQPA